MRMLKDMCGLQPFGNEVFISRAEPQAKWWTCLHSVGALLFPAPALLSVLFFVCALGERDGAARIMHIEVLDAPVMQVMFSKHLVACRIEHVQLQPNTWHLQSKPCTVHSEQNGGGKGRTSILCGLACSCQHGLTAMLREL